MKRLIKYIIVFLLGVLFTSGGVYAASLIKASDVSYKNGNVQDTIDELYELSNNSGIHVIELTDKIKRMSGGIGTNKIDMHDYLPADFDYSKLSVDNLYYKINTVYTEYYNNGTNDRVTNTATIQYSYDPSTGIYTIGVKNSASAVNNAFANGVLYVVY